MAVGKTAAVSYVQEHMPHVNVSYEANADVIQQVKSKGLNKNLPDDYVEIQRLWIRKEIERFEQAQAFDVTVMDFGAEEIEFYTLNYPKSIGADWPVAEKLHNELQKLRSCMPDRILFLDAGEQTLRAHKEKDDLRSRTFFEHYIKHLLPLKKRWFIGKKNVDVLCVDGLSKEEVGQQAREWVMRCVRDFAG